MISPRVRLQLIAFAVVSVLGVAYVGMSYAGLGRLLVGRGYTVHADFADSGGIYPDAEVTYRGKKVGRVGALRLAADGVRVDLVIDGDAPRIPADARAVVANRSAVGEQYVDLQPGRAGGPYLRPGEVVPRERTRIPLPVEALLLNLDRVVGSVDRENLAIVIDELGTAFDRRGPDLQRLLDQGDRLLAAARESLPETLRLIEDGTVVLATQRESRTAIRSWARDLRLLADQLRASDPDIRRLLDNGPVAAAEISELIRDNRTDLGVLISNLLTASEITVRRLPGMEQVLVTYPSAVAGGFTVVPGDGTSHFGLVLNAEDPPNCTRGYEGTRRRPPADTSPAPPNTRARCAEPRGSPTSVRGAQNSPRPGGSRSSGPAGGRAGWAAGPGSPELPGYSVGSTGGHRDVLADRSWLPLLLGPLGP
ncbi:MAG: MCE family protein [Mycobacteriales bacterium]